MQICIHASAWHQDVLHKWIRPFPFVQRQILEKAQSFELDRAAIRLKVLSDLLQNGIATALD